MAPTQRTKSGCWTCRLRRKKCSEGGPPCGTCEARQIFCHGYGRKPDWKDKGEKERQEAMRLQLEARGNEVRDTVVPPDRPSSSSSRRTETRGAAVGPEPPGTGSSPPPAGQPAGPEEILFNMDWSPEMVSSFSNDFTFFSSPTANIGDNNDLEAQPVLFADNPAHNHNAMSAGDPWPPWEVSTSGSSESNVYTQSERLSSDAGSSLHDLPLSITTTESQGRVDKEMDLIMHYISHFCSSSNIPTRQRTSSSSRGWLLFVLTRSPAFYNASLAISAYQQHHTSSQDDTLQTGFYHDYQEYRAQAARLFSVLNHCGICSFPGEDLLCAVQLSRLEALAGNAQNCQSYMASAKSAMLSGERIEMARPDPPVTSAIQRPLSPLSSILSSTTTGDRKPERLSFGSAMERKAIAVSQCLVVWNDLLVCSIQKTVPAAHETYRTWLSDPELMALLQETTGCEPWVLKAISDITQLEAWRKDQETRGALSIRALAGRADKIEAAIAGGIQRLTLADPGSPAVKPSNQTSGRRASSASTCSASTNHVPSHIHTSIFAHAATTYLHIVVSGPKPGISEIGHSIDRAIDSWKAFLGLLLQLLPPAAGGIREWPLAWPLCTTASLATGAQRVFFRDLVADLSQNTTMTTWATRTVSECRTVVEKCWLEIDQQTSDGAPSCDWRDVFQRCGFCHLFS
ncbi:uncharacterized protein PG986_008535 [Apiospora aurea]|uniref:Zn(2)-C6 fungal-type domain-containing protein n=1 Tax=Apiospora aurea TaxID=335848 RepID=A0ABR1QFR1_9PEZI